MNHSEFKSVFSNTKLNDDFYRFLQEIFHIYPEDKFHFLLASTAKDKGTDAEIYNSTQENLGKIKPFLSELTLALPALKKQKKEMARQVRVLLGEQKTVNGYLEIGSTGRYISELRKHIKLSGDLYLTNDVAPTNSLGDIFERGRLGKLGRFIPLNNYDPIKSTDIPDETLDLVTCHIGLHHCPAERLGGYLKSIHRVLRAGGRFIIRDHDVQTHDMTAFVSLVHTVFNLGLNVSWQTNEMEYKSFKSIDEWSRIISAAGFKDAGKRILQKNDPSLNTLVLFTKL
jgi:SAM-dependent methyltransferase